MSTPAFPKTNPGFKIFRNGCLYEQMDEFKHPWENPYRTPKFEGENARHKYRMWHGHTADATAPHFSPFIGLNPARHVCKANPAVMAVGFVGDYDSRLTDQEFEAGLVPDPTKKPYQPFAVNRTFSGGVRAVWVFEEPIPVWGTHEWLHFSTFLKKKLGLVHYWKNVDDCTTEKLFQSCVCGTDWRILGGVVPANIMRAWAFEAFASQSIQVGQKYDFSIPFDRINEEYKKKVDSGEFWDIGTELAPGLRCRRFWAKATEGSGEGHDPNGALVRDNGVQAFTGEQGFLSWHQIFGSKFCEDLRTTKIAEAFENIWKSPDGYHLKMSDGSWSPALNETKLARHLRVGGLSDEKKKGQTASLLDTALDFIELDKSHEVSGVVPFHYCADKVVEWNGERYLNSSTLKLMQPATADGDFSIITERLRDTFHGPHNLEHFLAWLKFWYTSALEGDMKQGQAAFIVGHPGTGKSFLATFILPAIFDGHEIFTDVATGLSSFNKELFDKAVWTCDDIETISQGKQKEFYTGCIKRSVANEAQKRKVKFGSESSVKFTGRIIVTSNEDPNSITALPDVVGSIMDKVNLYRGSDKKMGAPDLNAIREQLPYFLRWLTSMPEADWIEKDPRFGVKAFHDKHIKDIARINSSKHDVMEWVRDVFKARITAWREANKSQRYNEILRAEEIVRIIKSNDDTFKDRSKVNLSRSRLGRIISTMMDTGGYPWLIVERDKKAKANVFSADQDLIFLDDE